MNTEEMVRKVVERARANAGLDPMPWRTILRWAKTPKELALQIREYTMRNSLNVEEYHAKDPTYLSQWVTDNEKLAQKIEKCTNLDAAQNIIKNHIE